MGVRSDSYGTVDEVAAFCRFLLQGKVTFTEDTRPTKPEVEKFIDRTSAVLNNALWKAGFNPSVIRANSTAKLLCDDWVVSAVTERVELTQPGMGFNDSDRTRTGGFRTLHKKAAEFAMENALSFKNAGLAVAKPTSNGLAYTGLSKRSERTDIDSDTIEQPLFHRHQWDSPTAGRSGDDLINE